MADEQETSQGGQDARRDIPRKQNGIAVQAVANPNTTSAFPPPSPTREHTSTKAQGSSGPGPSRGKKGKKANAKKQSTVPDVYKEMLAELKDTSIDTAERPLKKRAPRRPQVGQTNSIDNAEPSMMVAPPSKPAGNKLPKGYLDPESEEESSLVEPARKNSKNPLYAFEDQTKLIAEGANSNKACKPVPKKTKKKPPPVASSSNVAPEPTKVVIILSDDEFGEEFSSPAPEPTGVVVIYSDDELEQESPVSTLITKPASKARAASISATSANTHAIQSLQPSSEVNSVVNTQESHHNPITLPNAPLQPRMVASHVPEIANKNKLKFFPPTPQADQAQLNSSYLQASNAEFNFPIASQSSQSSDPLQQLHDKAGLAPATHKKKKKKRTSQSAKTPTLDSNMESSTPSREDAPALESAKQPEVFPSTSIAPTMPSTSVAPSLPSTSFAPSLPSTSFAPVLPGDVALGAWRPEHNTPFARTSDEPPQKARATAGTTFFPLPSPNAPVSSVSQPAQASSSSDDKLASLSANLQLESTPTGLSASSEAASNTTVVPAVSAPEPGPARPRIILNVRSRRPGASANRTVASSSAAGQSNPAPAISNVPAPAANQPPLLMGRPRIARTLVANRGHAPLQPPQSTIYQYDVELFLYYACRMFQGHHLNDDARINSNYQEMVTILMKWQGATEYSLVPITHSSQNGHDIGHLLATTAVSRGLQSILPDLGQFFLGCQNTAMDYIRNMSDEDIAAYEEEPESSWLYLQHTEKHFFERAKDEVGRVLNVELARLQAQPEVPDAGRANVAPAGRGVNAVGEGRGWGARGRGGIVRGRGRGRGMVFAPWGGPGGF
ncbi:hypothetical protein VTL71DRAFT_9908 [Oculimacula yallundae]|uniref:Uncharacterized protein n=1 Tax=Oculimacula yallundae TaxID=86028 RepID=A0ABR4BQX1_9HELO